MTDRPASALRVVLFTGPPGTGKSTLAVEAARTFQAPLLGWDWAMASLTWCEPVQTALQSLDPADYRRIGWSILENLTEAQLRIGRSVILDGVARADEVAMVRALADRHDADSIVVVTACSDEIRHRARIERRDRAIPGWHELDWDHIADFLPRWTPPEDVDLTIDTADNPHPATVIRRLVS